MNFDLDEFEERAAIMEFDGGLTRFKAETEAAKRQGLTRWQAMGARSEQLGNLAAARDQGGEGQRDVPHDMPRVQRGAAKQNGSMPECQHQG